MRIVRTKKKRLEIIQQIITTQKISSQIELLQVLSEAGIDVTQATLSRDLKHLQIAKIPDHSGCYIYTMPNNEVGRSKQVNPTTYRHPIVGMGGFLSIAFSGNIVVVKTSPGYAGSIAYDIDKGNAPQILGTVAGDDTIFIVLKEDVLHEDAYEILSQYIPALRTY